MNVCVDLSKLFLASETRVAGVFFARTGSAPARRRRSNKHKAEMQGFPPDRPNPFGNVEGEDHVAFSAFMEERIEIPTHLRGINVNGNLEKR